MLKIFISKLVQAGNIQDNYRAERLDIPLQVINPELMTGFQEEKVFLLYYSIQN
jgi:hypothetical protein